MILLNLIAILLIAYGVIGMFIRLENNRPLPLKIPAILLGVIILLLVSFIVKIGAQDVGVKVTPRGVSDEELQTGWHIVAPWNDVHKMDKTVWVYTCAYSTKEGNKADADAIWAPTKDGIKMGFDVSVSWKIIPSAASWIYSNVTENDGEESGRYLWLEENVIRPKLKSGLALTVSKYTPIEAYSTAREHIQAEVKQRIENEVKEYRLIVDQVDIREVYYNPEYEASINNKKLAEQEALRLIEVTKQKQEQLKQAEIDKNIAIQQAEGEAKALQIKGTSIAKNPKIIELEWINKWDGKLPTYSVGGNTSMLLSVPSPK